MSRTLQRISLSIRPVHTPNVRVISPSIRTAAAFARKQDESLPLRLPRKSRKPQEIQKRAQQKAEIPTRPPQYDSPPLPLGVPTMQEQNPTEAYFIRRTPTKNLPVYQLTKAGGNLKQTRVRKIEGEIIQLKQQLESTLQPTPEWIRINPVTGHVEMKGWYKDQIDKLLLSKGF